MSRDIEFRVWIKPNDPNPDGLMVYQDSKSDYRMISNGNGFGVLEDMESWMDKESFVIMQYIGLKDVNGIEIYEGDLHKRQILCRHPKGICHGTYWVDYICSVEYKGYGFFSKALKQINHINLEFRAAFGEPINEAIEIIGNIHENIGLLK